MLKAATATTPLPTWKESRLHDGKAHCWEVTWKAAVHIGQVGRIQARHVGTQGSRRHLGIHGHLKGCLLFFVGDTWMGGTW